MIFDGLRQSLHGVTNNKVWFGVQLFMHVLFFYFNFSQEVICPSLFSHMWRNLYCQLIHIGSSVLGTEEMNLMHDVTPTVNADLLRMIFSTINAENYAKPRLGVQHNWSLSTPGSLLILSLNIKNHVTVSLKILYQHQQYRAQIHQHFTHDPS